MNSGLTVEQLESLKNVLILNNSINATINEYLESIDGTTKHPKETKYFKNEIDKLLHNVQLEIKRGFNLSLFDFI